MQQGDEKNTRESYREIKEGELTVREAKPGLRNHKEEEDWKYYQYRFQAPEKDSISKIKPTEPRIYLQAA